MWVQTQGLPGAPTDLQLTPPHFAALAQPASYNLPPAPPPTTKQHGPASKPKRSTTPTPSSLRDGLSFLSVSPEPEDLDEPTTPRPRRRRSPRRSRDRYGYIDLDDSGQSASRPLPPTPKNELPPLVPRSPGALSSSSPTSSRRGLDSTRNDTRQAWPPPRKESLSTKTLTPWFDPHSTTMDSINIAVIGAEGVGKSAFIQRALRLPRPPTANLTQLRQDVDGIPHAVTLTELDLELFDVDPDQPVQWPKQANGHMAPRMDGAMILYDVMNKESIRELPPTMSALSKSSLPIVLVATKCDTPENLRQLDTQGVASAFPQCVADFKTSANVPGSARDCMQAMLRVAVANRRGELKREEVTTSRRRAASTANLDAPTDALNGRPNSQQSSKHSRASSDLSLLRGIPPASNDGAYYRGPGSRSPRLEYQNQNPNSAASFGVDAPEDGAGRTVSSMLRTPGIRLDGGPQETFLDIEESDADSYRYSDDIPILQRNDEVLDRPAKLAGIGFDELMDRLLAPRMSRADNNFADIFLCLYRKFAAPGELLAAILARLDRIKDDNLAQYLTKTETQMRIIEVVAKWVASYPGDFARSTTRKSLEELIRHLSTEPVFAAASHQMWQHLEQRVTEDDDTGWAKSDERDTETDRFSGVSKEAASELSSTMSGTHLDEPDVHPGQRRPSIGSEVSGSELGSDRVPARFQFHSFEDYEREAATMIPRATLPLNKFRYHIFMDIDPDDIADEITRIDWVMFSSIRIRDLVRVGSLSVSEKEKCRSLKNVNRMTTHFNHVAKWVANMILIRDKAKHRAPCLEKFMVIAQKLRQLNNYNGLAAVMAGINGTAIHRLGATRALVSPDVGKRFARLELLLSTQKSHFAYRLAWENSPLPRIPFMPLHRRDLVSAEEGSRTFVGPNNDRINWKKFEILGEVLLPIMRSQGQPYPNLNRHEMSRELILDCRMMIDDEDIYQRSVAVESSSNSAAESGKKKFPWMSK
ncbi:ras GEF [Thozetella sp. PMI_491]|nr:ras GEF [Thozetella sp. PMI_491]